MLKFMFISGILFSLIEFLILINWRWSKHNESHYYEGEKFGLKVWHVLLGILLNCVPGLNYFIFIIFIVFLLVGWQEYYLVGIFSSKIFRKFINLLNKDI